MKILIIEDEIKLAKAIKRALELQNYTINLALDGEEGLDLVLNESYELIILDLMLPKIEGMEICRQVRDEKILTPILILSAKGELNDKVKGLDFGADDYMVKPFSLEELLARIRALTRRSIGTKSNEFKIKDLSLSIATFEVKKGKEKIELSAKEFAILEYLMRHKNKVITREQIVTSVWNYDSEVLPTTVEVHIKHLRDKIGDQKGEIIKTVRGFGYKIIDE